MSKSGATAWDGDRSIVRGPDPAIEVIDERFRPLIVGAEIVEQLWTGGRWLEGLVWFGDGREPIALQRLHRGSRIPATLGRAA